jgi:hypothetical protein
MIITKKINKLQKEKEYLIQRKKEDSSIVTGNYFTPSKKDAD